MFASILQQAPAQTTNFMIAGYVVIFGVMFLYIISLAVRARKLRQQLVMLEELEDREK